MRSSWMHQRPRKESEWPAKISSHKECHNSLLTVPTSPGEYRSESIWQELSIFQVFLFAVREVLYFMEYCTSKKFHLNSAL